MPIAVTDRLILREMNPQDAAFVFALNADKEVMKYTGDEPFESEQAARTFLENYEHYKKYGFGRWGVQLKETGQLIGWCGLKNSPEKKEHDLGFRFLKKHWGKGYATEAAAQCLQLGFNTFGIHCILGRAMKQNLASIQVLQKIGMDFWKEALCGDEPGLIFRKFNSHM